jgi:hypothetical protein
MKVRKIVSTPFIFLLILFVCACSNDGQNNPSFLPSATPPQNETTGVSPTLPRQTSGDSEIAEAGVLSGELVISFDYERISGSASNQYAVWIEDMDGGYINTVYATQWTANGGYSTRPDSIAIWVDKSDIASMPDYYVDAISGATPRTGSQSYAWNLKDIDGNTVAAGEYKFFVKGTLRWKNYVLYSGVIALGGSPVTVEADAEFFYEASDRQAALTGDSPENAMIGAVTASYIPSGN